MRYAKLLLPILLLTLLAPACHTPPARQAFSVSVAGRIGVDAALEQFKGLTRAGKVNRADFLKAKDALAAYQAANVSYLEALRASLDENPTQPKPVGSTVVAALSGAYNALYQILVIYVPNLDPTPPQ